MARPRKQPEKHVRRSVYLNYQTVESAIAGLVAAAEGLRAPTVVVERYNRYGDSEIEVCVEGYVPMTKEEIAAERKQRREASLDAEARDRETYERLKERFGDT